LGGALWRPRSVFGHGVHTRHHWRYVILSLPTPHPSATTSCIHFSNVLLILSNRIGSGLYALAFGIMGLLPAPRVARQ
jgi:hypothetical protein